MRMFEIDEPNHRMEYIRSVRPEGMSGHSH